MSFILFVWVANFFFTPFTCFIDIKKLTGKYANTFLNIFGRNKVIAIYAIILYVIEYNVAWQGRKLERLKEISEETVSKI